MTSQEATFWVSCALLAGAVVLGGIGAALDENKQKQAAMPFLALAGALACMAGAGGIKWIAGFFFN